MRTFEERTLIEDIGPDRLGRYAHRRPHGEPRAAAGDAALRGPGQRAGRGGVMKPGSFGDENALVELLGNVKSETRDRSTSHV